MDFTVVQNSLIKLLKSEYPTMDVFTEIIAVTDDNNARAATENYFYIDLTPTGLENFGAHQSQVTLLVDISAHLKTESKKDYLVLSKKIDSMVRPVLRFEDRAITINNAEIRVVDNILHYIFTFSFLAGELPDESGIELMENLDLGV